MNTEYVAPAPFEIDRATPMCQNYTHDVQTQVVSVFGGVLAADREVGSNHCPDEKGTERYYQRKYRTRKEKVATIAPTKRGLKGCYRTPPPLPCAVATIAPTKRGLKVYTYTVAGVGLPGSNHCPDEKGD